MTSCCVKAVLAVAKGNTAIHVVWGAECESLPSRPWVLPGHPHTRAAGNWGHGAGDTSLADVLLHYRFPLSKSPVTARMIVAC